MLVETTGQSKNANNDPHYCGDGDGDGDGNGDGDGDGITKERTPLPLTESFSTSTSTTSINASMLFANDSPNGSATGMFFDAGVC
jgi:hypothetical protein